MGSNNKIREIDYDRSEIMEISNINNRTTFNKKYNKFCDMYDFEKVDFKIDKSETGNFYFPIDIAELVGVLLKTQKDHPLERTNARVEKIKGTDIKHYIDQINECIETEIDDSFKKLIYMLPSHLSNVYTSDYLTILIENLSIFIANITKLRHQDVGSLVKYLSYELDKINYNLFCGNHIYELAQESNKECIDEDFTEIMNIIYGPINIEKNEIEELAFIPNITIDIAISRIIKRIMLDIDDLNYKDKYRGDKYKSDNELLKERKRYLDKNINEYIDPVKYKESEAIINNYKEHMKNYKPIVDKLKDGTLNYGYNQYTYTLGEKKILLERQIKDMQEQLSEVNEEINIKGENYKEENVISEELKNSYIKYYNEIKGDSVELYECVDNFIGQILAKNIF